MPGLFVLESAGKAKPGVLNGVAKAVLRCAWTTALQSMLGQAVAVSCQPLPPAWESWF